MNVFKENGKNNAMKLAKEIALKKFVIKLKAFVVKDVKKVGLVNNVILFAQIVNQENVLMMENVKNNNAI